MTQMHIKDPQAVKDYAWNWNDWLSAGDAISSFTVTTTKGDVVVDTLPVPAHAGGVVTAWLSGGTDGTDAEVTCHIETAQGREDDRTLYFRIRHQ
jgi:hypothetical protein